MSRATFDPMRIDDAPMHTLGQRLQDDVGGEYVYGQANGALVDAALCKITQAGQVDAITTAEADDWLGGPLCGSLQAVADNKYAWFRTYGWGHVLIDNDVAAGKQLYTTTDAGKVDDATSGGPINGLMIPSAGDESAQNRVVAWFGYPTISDTQ